MDKINTGRFKKGMVPWNKGKKGLIPSWNKGKKGLQVAWNKGIPRSDETKQKLREANLGKHLSEETKRKIGEAGKGRHHSEETRIKISIAHKGIPITEEHRKHLSESHMGHKHSEETKQKMKGRVSWNKGKMMPGVHTSGFKGHKHTEEAKQKCRAAHLERRVGEDTKQKLRTINVGKKLSEETKRKISEHKKGISSWNKGIPMPEKQREALRKVNIGNHRNANHNNPVWKGDAVGYTAMHGWIRRHKQKPALCEECNEKPPRDLANLSGDYKRDINDFKWMCRSCHIKYDRAHGKGPMARFDLKNKYREKLKRVIHDFTKQQWMAKVEQTNGICTFCNKPYAEGNGLSIDHNPAISLVPDGYVYKLECVVPMCASCNSSKNKKNLKMWSNINKKSFDFLNAQRPERRIETF